MGPGPCPSELYGTSILSFLIVWDQGPVLPDCMEPVSCPSELYGTSALSFLIVWDQDPVLLDCMGPGSCPSWLYGTRTLSFLIVWDQDPVLLHHEVICQIPLLCWHAHDWKHYLHKGETGAWERAWALMSDRYFLVSPGQWDPVPLHHGKKALPPADTQTRLKTLPSLIKWPVLWKHINVEIVCCLYNDL